MSIGVQPIIPINEVDPNTLLVNLREFLIQNGIGRDPRASDTGANLPPIWIEPRRGIPYPGQTDGLAPSEQSMLAVMSLEYSTEIPSAPYEGFMSRQHITVWYRTKTAPPAKSMHTSVKNLLHDQRDYSLNGLEVNESMLYRGLQPLGPDSVSYTYNSEYEFTLFSY